VINYEVIGHEIKLGIFILKSIRVTSKVYNVYIDFITFRKF